MTVPVELRRNLPRIQQEMADPRVILPIGVFVFGGLIYASSKYPNGWLRILPPALGPFATAAFFTLRPWNPYDIRFPRRTNRAARVLETDPSAKRLLSNLHSADALKVIWKTAVITSLSFVSLILIGSTLTAPPRSWEIPVFELLVYVWLWATLSTLIFCNRLLMWAFRSWQ